MPKGPSSSVAGIVLAGGQSRRLGRDKAVEPMGGQPLIRRVMDRLSQVADGLVVVVADAARGDALPLEQQHQVACDQYPGGGSLGGIFSGLAAMEQEWGLVVACDMPFLNLDLLRHMLSLRQGYDAVVPVLEGRPEPTHALYSKACLAPIEERLQADDLKISGFFDQVRVNYLAEQDLARFDPDYLSFFNVNSPEDLAKALDWVSQGR
ncbi:MAG: molybdenum cofactor guanylyltransferase [Dehalococcoidia bacterium]